MVAAFTSRAMDAAKDAIRIEICVLEDPQILERVQAWQGMLP
ncbi:MAG: hypothetical protein WCC25_05105 [Candidatus Korobacteraceae bacterium]